MGDDPRTSVVDADCRSWDIPNLWICDGSVFPTVGGVNPSLTIQAIACRTADRIRALAARGELGKVSQCMNRRATGSSSSPAAAPASAARPSRRSPAPGGMSASSRVTQGGWNARPTQSVRPAAMPCTVSADVADAAAVEDAAARIEQALGPIDVWVNNAMATVFAPVAALTPEEILRATQVTYLGQVHGTMAALRRMRDRNRGTIVNVGRRWRTGRSRCNRPIAPPSSPSVVLPTRCAPRCCMTGSTSRSRWCICRR